MAGGYPPIKILADGPEWLEEHFSKPGATVKTAADELGCNEKTVRRWMAKYDIKTRPMSENAWLRQAAHEKVSDLGKEIIEGELLGDGCLSSRSNYSAFYQHTSSKRDYLEWLRDTLIKEGLRFTKRIAKSQTPLGETYHLKSRSFTDLKALHRRWYADGVKIVPADIVLTPAMALHWFLGDGSTHKVAKDTHNSILELDTHGFTSADLDILCEQLSGFNAYYRNGNVGDDPDKGRAIFIPAPDAPRFLEWIGDCPVEVYTYKWNLSRTYEIPK